VHKEVVAAFLAVSLFLGYWLSCRVCHTWKIYFLVIIGHFNEVLGLGDLSLGRIFSVWYFDY
jgi:hypothetical protein